MQRLLLLHYSVGRAAFTLKCGAYYFCITILRLLLLHYSVAPATSLLQYSAFFFCITV
jgi:hypothetical protein